MTDPDQQKIPNEPHRAVLRTAVGATVVIAIGAFILSFAALTDLAERSGIESHLAWIWPIIVDGMIVAATVAIVALNGHPRKALIYPWALLFFGALVSTAANSVHAILTVESTQSGIPPVVSALVAAMPPVVLLAITHLTVHMYQRRAEAAQLRDERQAVLDAEYAESAEAKAAERAGIEAEVDARYREFYESQLNERIHALHAEWTAAEQADPAAAAAEGLEPAFDQYDDAARGSAAPAPAAARAASDGPAPLYDDTWERIAPGTPSPGSRA
ncbi:DUF2637 domain-containing protein [Zhihengliuella salsuginis]|uniref:DUF2637 domain-containing protein n=1 Tax=Zhihengliuella salsuginis TaxID=578222 RepID=A0ABQ3GI19_9MICC|nr:DUF2637 domain-containing protein [Zhihengliuella salsuginis]GHD05294.1 hypothetical protein GCM10008096_13990 [Zhihengliuella salsuginis]